MSEQIHVQYLHLEKIKTNPEFQRFQLNLLCQTFILILHGKFQQVLDD